MTSVGETRWGVIVSGLVKGDMQYAGAIGEYWPRTNVTDRVSEEFRPHAALHAYQLSKGNQTWTWRACELVGDELRAPLSLLTDEETDLYLAYLEDQAELKAINEELKEPQPDPQGFGQWLPPQGYYYNPKDWEPHFFKLEFKPEVPPPEPPKPYGAEMPNRNESRKLYKLSDSEVKRYSGKKSDDYQRAMRHAQRGFNMKGRF